MKIIANFARILVGLEFIFSGFVKVVDPYGTGLKLQEYFEVFSKDLPIFSGFFQFFADHGLALSVIFCASELVLGVALLFNYKLKWSSWAALLLMLFFTVLTFYSAYFNKVTDCGCFGDFMKLKPWHSFYKDVISIFFISIIFIYRNKFNAFKWGSPFVLVSIVISLGLAFYAIKYLPVIDFLAYAKGKSIPKQMEQPKIKPDIEYKFLDKSIKKEISSKEYLMDTLRFKYLSSETLNQDALIPKITDYSLADSSGNDFTQESFKGARLFVILKKIDGLESIDFEKIKNLNKGISNKVNSMILSSIPTKDYFEFSKKKNLDIPYYSCDEKVLKTMARTNPCFILLKDGVVINKWAYANMPTSTEILELINN